eukprot:scaffold732_cov265-Alexandrium_tamarense.AAC.9
MRQDACTMACDVLSMNVDQGKLLPSVLIGSLGEGCIVPLLRLILAIAQNGQHELRGELLRTGAIVCVSDMMQQSLQAGDRYTFSTSIAIIRLCGPCLSIGDSGTITSLQNAIRTLSAVLSISEQGGSINQQQTNTLASLKLESLLALEALSNNVSLHNSISSDALPALGMLLKREKGQMQSSDGESESMICSALKTIQRIASSNAELVVRSGIASTLVECLQGSPGTIQEVSSQLLHDLASVEHSGATEMRGVLLTSGVLEGCASVISDKGVLPHTTMLCLEIIELVVSNAPTSPETSRRVIQSMNGQESFLRVLIATMMSSERKRLVDGCIATGSDHDQQLNIQPLYGEPLQLDDDGSSSAVRILTKLSFLLCSDAEGEKLFQDALMLRNVRGSSVVVSIACCVLLDVWRGESNGIGEQGSLAAQSILVESLSSSLEESLSSSASSNHAEAIIAIFKVPELCLAMCQSQSLAQAAFDLFEAVVLPLPTIKLGQLLLTNESTLLALFELVTGQNNQVLDKDHAKQTFASVLGALAKAGLLPAAVERLNVRSRAIAALSAAMLMNGDGNLIIDDDEDSMPRICIESLAAILSSQQDSMDMTPLEARALATAIGKALSSTVLNRFFTQASLESTLDASVDHSHDRALISKSAEARLLCAIASFPESLVVVSEVGGLEAISLIAHEGEIGAIKALRKACVISAKSIVDVDAHLSVMDALVSVENKLSSDHANHGDFRELAVECIDIISSLVEGEETKTAMLRSEQSYEVSSIAACILSASSALHASKALVNDGSTSEDTSDVAEEPSKNMALLTEAEEPNNEMTVLSLEELQLNDSVVIDLSSSNDDPSPSNSSGPIQQLKGVVAHLGSVEFAPGDDWIGISLTGNSVGLGRNNGSVKGVSYFDAGGEKNGMFVRKAHVKKQQPTSLPKCDATDAEATEVPTSSILERDEPSHTNKEREKVWECLLAKNDFAMEKAAASLLLAFASSKPHRDQMMANESLVHAAVNVIQSESTALLDFQFILMTAGVSTLSCAVPISESQGREHWDSSLSFCLFILSSTMNESSQEILGASFATLIGNVQPSPNAFSDCLKYIVEKRGSSVSSVSAKQILRRMDIL